MIRLFVGLELPEIAKTQLMLLSRGIKGARWQTPEQMHLTLKFVGEVEEPVLVDVADVLAGIHAPDFDLAIKGVGYFGKAHMARILWAGIAPNPELKELHERIEFALQTCGIAPETRRFTPHVTLARVHGAKATDVEEFAARYSELQLASFPVSHFSLFESNLGNSGAHYTVLDRFSLSHTEPIEDLANLLDIPAAE